MFVRQRIEPQSLSCSVAGSAYFAELDFRDRQQAGKGHADGTADDTLLGQRCVKDAIGSEFLLKPQRYGVDATLGTDILAKDQHAGIQPQFLIENATDRRDHTERCPSGRARSVLAGAAQP